LGMAVVQTAAAVLVGLEMARAARAVGEMAAVTRERATLAMAMVTEVEEATAVNQPVALDSEMAAEAWVVAARAEAGQAGVVGVVGVMVKEVQRAAVAVEVRVAVLQAVVLQAAVVWAAAAWVVADRVMAVVELVALVMVEAAQAVVKRVVAE